MKKEQDNNLIDYNKIYNEIYHKVMKQLNEKQNSPNLNAILDTELKKEKKEVQTITLNPNDVNKYFLMKIKGKTKVAKLYEFIFSKKEFAFITSDGVLYITDENGISNEMNDVLVVQKLEYFPNIDLTENTKYGDVFITKNGHKLKYIYKLSNSNNQEFIYVFTDDNKVYHYNRYGEYRAYQGYTNRNNLYVKYEEKENNTNNVLDITSDIIKQSNENFKDLMKFKDLMEQNVDSTLNKNYNQKYNQINYNNSETDGVKQTLPIGTLYINKENYTIICIKDTQQSLMFNSIQCLVDMYSLDEDYHYKLYKNQYMLFDLTTLSKEDTSNNIEGYIQITQEEFNNIIKNNEITKNNIKIIKRDFINLLNNTILYNKLYPKT